MLYPEDPLESTRRSFGFKCLLYCNGFNPFVNVTMRLVRAAMPHEKVFSHSGDRHKLDKDIVPAFNRHNDI